MDLALAHRLVGGELGVPLGVLGGRLKNAIEVQPWTSTWPLMTGATILKGSDTVVLGLSPGSGGLGSNSLALSSDGHPGVVFKAEGNTIPATILSQHEHVVCILLKGRDLPMMAALSSLSFQAG